MHPFGHSSASGFQYMKTQQCQVQESPLDCSVHTEHAEDLSVRSWSNARSTNGNAMEQSCNFRNGARYQPGLNTSEPSPINYHIRATPPQENFSMPMPSHTEHIRPTFLQPSPSPSFIFRQTPKPPTTNNTTSRQPASAPPPPVAENGVVGSILKAQKNALDYDMMPNSFAQINATSNNARADSPFFLIDTRPSSRIESITPLARPFSTISREGESNATAIQQGSRPGSLLNFSLPQSGFNYFPALSRPPSAFGELPLNLSRPGSVMFGSTPSTPFYQALSRPASSFTETPLNLSRSESVRTLPVGGTSPTLQQKEMSWCPPHVKTKPSIAKRIAVNSRRQSSLQQPAQASSPRPGRSSTPERLNEVVRKLKVSKVDDQPKLQTRLIEPEVLFKKSAKRQSRGKSLSQLQSGNHFKKQNRSRLPKFPSYKESLSDEAADNIISKLTKCTISTSPPKPRSRVSEEDAGKIIHQMTQIRITAPKPVQEKGARCDAKPVKSQCGGLLAKTMENGRSEILLNTLEENYLNHRDMVFDRYQGLMTPLRFLILLCRHTGIKLHKEMFIFISPDNTSQWRTELFVGMFCGLAHATRSGLSLQLAAAHVVERICIFLNLKPWSRPLCALFPGNAYTGICDELEGLCRRYNVGNVVYECKDRKIDEVNTSPSVVIKPQFEIICGVSNRFACVESDDKLFGKYHAARNMYEMLVNPSTAAPLARVRDYFAIGAECPSLDDIHSSLSLKGTSRDKEKWKKKYNIENTEPWLHDPTDESKYIYRLNASYLENARQSMLEAIEWIEKTYHERNDLHGTKLGYFPRRPPGQCVASDEKGSNGESDDLEEGEIKNEEDVIGGSDKEIFHDAMDISLS